MLRGSRGARKSTKVKKERKATTRENLRRVQGKSGQGDPPGGGDGRTTTTVFPFSFTKSFGNQACGAILEVEDYFLRKLRDIAINVA